MSPKTGPGRKSNCLAAMSKTLTPMMSEGIRSGVNWIRLKRGPGHVGQGPAQQGLAGPRDAFEQGVPAGQQGDHRFFDDRFLPDQGFAQFLRDATGQARLPLPDPFKVSFSMRAKLLDGCRELPLGYLSVGTGARSHSSRMR